MVGPLWWFTWGALLLGSLGFVAVGARTFYRRSFPGRASFTAYCLLIAMLGVALTGLSVVLALKNQLGAPVPAAVLALLEDFTRVGTFAAALLAPLLWLRFVVAYTGQRIPTDRRTLLVVGSPVVLTMAALAVFIVFSLLPFVYDVSTIPGVVVVVVVGTVEYLLNVTGFYIAALLVAGASLVIWTNYRYRHLSTTGGALLAVGSTLPWAAASVPFVANLFERDPLLEAHAAAGMLVGLTALGVATTGKGVFESLPAAGTVGRDVTVETMNDPVVVVDENRRVVDLNPSVEQLFGVSGDVFGAPLAAVVGEDVDQEALLAGPPHEFELAERGRVIEAVGSALEDEYGRALGHSVVFHDITDRKRRQQRIQVLNRVLRHNLRNDMSVVNGHADALADMPFDLEGHPEHIRRTADGLLHMGEKARRIELVVASDVEPTAELSGVLEDAVADVRETYGECAFRVEGAAEDVAVDGTVLGAVLQELLENACEHNEAEDPRVCVTATLGEGGGHERPLEVTVTDNGPGIPGHELAPIREGRETDLEHGSGLGLWLVEWGVATVGGRLSFERRRDDATGTRVRIRLPWGR